MFMSTNSKENWVNGAEQLNKSETKTNEQAKERANEQQYKQTDSRLTELTIKRSTEFSPVKGNERKPSERTRKTRWTAEQPSGQLFWLEL